jgi:hypothetical protein
MKRAKIRFDVVLFRRFSRSCILVNFTEVCHHILVVKSRQM